MNAKLRRTSSVVVVLVLVLAGALVQSFGGNAAAQSNSEGTLQGTWRVQHKPIKSPNRASPPSLPPLAAHAPRGALPTHFVYQHFSSSQRAPRPRRCSH